MLAAAFPGGGVGGGETQHILSGWGGQGGMHLTEAERTVLLAGTPLDGGAHVLSSRPRLWFSSSLWASEGEAW